MDLTSVRENHLSLVVNLLRERGSISRADLVRITKLSPTTVSSLINQLLNSGFVYESQKGASSGGRPPVLVEFNYKHRHVIGVDLDETQLRLVTIDLQGEVVNSRLAPFDMAHDPAGAIQIIIRLIGEMMTELGLATLPGIGVAVPAPLEGEKLDRLSPNILPKWRDFDLVGRLHDAFGVPIHLDNDGNVGALAASWWGLGRDYRNLAFIKLGIGVGCGLVIENQVYRGAGGAAGEIGHITMAVDGPLCRCGNYGCLESFVSVPAILQQVVQQQGYQPTPEPLTIEVVVARGLQGDPVCRTVLVNAGTYLGIATANLLNLLNPELVIISGAIAAAGDLLAGAMNAAIKTHTIAKAAQEAKIAFTLLDNNHVALGAATLALQAALHPSNLLCTLQG